MVNIEVRTMKKLENTGYEIFLPSELAILAKQAAASR